MELKGKVALLTGGARIGQVVAIALAGRGCALALTYRNSRAAAESTVTAARAAGVEAAAIRADAIDEAQIKAAVNETVALAGPARHPDQSRLHLRAHARSRRAGVGKFDGFQRPQRFSVRDPFRASHEKRRRADREFQ